MDAVKIIKFFTENVIEWTRITVQTIVNPISRFRLVELPSNATTKIIAPKTERELWLNPKLLVYTVVSIVLGLTINALIPDRDAGPDLFQSVVVVFVYWIIGCSLLYKFCRLLGGRGTYSETLSVLLQVTGSLYVLSSFLSLLMAVPISLLFSDETLNSINFGFLSIPYTVAGFFVINGILHFIYYPITLKPVHKLGWKQVFLIWVFLLFLYLIQLYVYQVFGILIGGFLSLE